MLSRLDSIVLNPISGPILLALVLFLMFQAVFSWAKVPMDLIQASGFAHVLPYVGVLVAAAVEGEIAYIGAATLVAGGFPIFSKSGLGWDVRPAWPNP